MESGSRAFLDEEGDVLGKSMKSEIQEVEDLQKLVGKDFIRPKAKSPLPKPKKSQVP